MTLISGSKVKVTNCCLRPHFRDINLGVKGQGRKKCFLDSVSQFSDFFSLTDQFRSKSHTRRSNTQGLVHFGDIDLGVKGGGHNLWPSQKVFFETACL